MAKLTIELFGTPTEGCDYPAATNVLSGVVYANGTLTGTLMVSNSIDLNNAEKVTSTGCFFLETGGWWVDALDGDVIGEILVSADGETFREPEFTPIVPLYLISGGLYVRAKDAAIPVYVRRGPDTVPNDNNTVIPRV